MKSIQKVPTDKWSKEPYSQLAGNIATTFHYSHAELLAYDEHELMMRGSRYLVDPFTEIEFDMVLEKKIAIFVR